MAVVIREVKESPVEQGSGEQIVYTFDFSLIGVPTSPTVVLRDSSLSIVNGKLTGSPSVVGSTVLTPMLGSLVAGKKFRLDCQVVISGNTLVHYCWIECGV